MKLRAKWRHAAMRPVERRVSGVIGLCQGASETLVGWLSPAFTFDRNAAAMMAGFLSNMIVSNGPAANPIPPITRRVMSSLDLINLGFHTESFVNLFSLVDDLTQEVIKAGMNLLPAETIEAVNVLLALIDWLRSNPFGFTIPRFPLLRIAEPEFSIVPIKEPDAASKVDPAPDIPPASGAS